MNGFRFGHRHDQFYTGDIRLRQAVPLWQVHFLAANSQPAST